MLSPREKKRYSRHLVLPGFGEEAQEKLKAARVLVIGAGGLGCPALLYLTAAGVGTLGIMDDDTVDVTNLQRQVLFSEENIGRPKAATAAEKLRNNNPHVNFEVFSNRLSRENAMDVIRRFDLVIDGSDNFATRYLINDACVLLKKPFVYGSIFKFEGQVSVFNLGEGPTYRCLFPEPPAPGEVPTCSEIGVLGVLPGVIGSLQACEAIKVITGKGEPLSGTLLIINLFDNNRTAINIDPVPENKNIKALGKYEEENCDVPGVTHLDLDELKKWRSAGKKFELVDIREDWEFDEENIGGRNIPFHSLPARMAELEQEGPVVFICKRGENSSLAVKLFKEKYPDREVYSISGGIEGDR